MTCNARKSGRCFLVPKLVVNVVLLVVVTLGVMPPVNAGPGAVVSPGRDILEVQRGLENEKLREEIRQLRRNNDQLESGVGWLVANGIIITILVAVVGILLRIQKQIFEQNKNSDQRKMELERYTDNKFLNTIACLSSSDIAVRTNCFSDLMIFLLDGHKEFHKRVFFILLTLLKSEPDNEDPTAVSFHKQKVLGFEKALRKWLQQFDKLGALDELDLSRAYLDRLNLSGIKKLGVVDLTEARLVYADLTDTNLVRCKGKRANLSHARLPGANLMEARMQYAVCSRANFRGTRMASANFKRAVLTRAEFQDASLQAVHFDGADLTGALFYGADLNDTFFLNAQLGAKSLNSIVLARNWEKAHFDKRTEAQLQSLHS